MHTTITIASCVIRQYTRAVWVLALISFLGFPRIRPNPADIPAPFSLFTPNPLLLQLRGGTACRQARPKAEPQLLRKWRGESLGVLDGREIEGPMPPPPQPKKAKAVR